VAKFDSLVLGKPSQGLVVWACEKPSAGLVVCTCTIEGRFLNLSLKMRGNLVQSVQKPSETKSFEMEST
jgi:hypothetical protein